MVLGAAVLADGNFPASSVNARFEELKLFSFLGTVFLAKYLVLWRTTCFCKILWEESHTHSFVVVHAAFVLQRQT